MTLLRVFLIASLLVPVFASAQSGTQQPRVYDEVRAQVRSLITATNYDVMTTMDMYVRSPRISSINDERIVRGWNDLYRHTREAVPGQGSFFVRLGEIDVTLMGPEHALAVAPMTMEYQTEGGRVQLPGSMTLAFQRTPDGWKVLHEHYSTGLDQQALAQMAAQAGAGGGGWGSFLRLLLAAYNGNLSGFTEELTNLFGSP